MAVYPANLPISFPFGEDAPDYQVIRTPMELSYVQTRARTTVAPRVFRFAHRTLTAAELATWLAFWNARKGGGETFQFSDPRTAAVINCRFLDATYRMVRAAPNAYDVEVALEEAL